MQGWGNRGQRLDGLGCQAGFGWVAETRETAKGLEPGYRLARDTSGKPSNHAIGESDEPNFQPPGSAFSPRRASQNKPASQQAAEGRFPALGRLQLAVHRPAGRRRQAGLEWTEYTRLSGVAIAEVLWSYHGAIRVL